MKPQIDADERRREISRFHGFREDEGLLTGARYEDAG